MSASSSNKVLVLLDNNYSWDSRVENQIELLVEKGLTVDLYALSDENLPKEEKKENLTVRRIIPEIIYRPFSKENRSFVKEFVNNIEEGYYQIVHCHDFRMLQLGRLIKKKDPSVKLLYDSHEYLSGYPYYQRLPTTLLKIKGWLVWQFYLWNERTSFPYLDGIITVSEKIREELQKYSGVETIVIRNLPREINICNEKCDYWKEKYKLPNDAVIMIHTGNVHFSDDRFLFLDKLVRESENLFLVFLGTTKSLGQLQQNHGLKNEKIFFHEHIPRKYVTYYCSQASIGLVYTWNKDWKSYWYALPNKMMDVSLAGIPVLCTEQPELKSFVNQFGHGVAFNGDSYEDMKLAFERILADYDQYKEKAINVSSEVNWEKESKKLLKLYDSMLS